MLNTRSEQRRHWNDQRNCKMPILLLVKVRNFAVPQCWVRAQNALFVRKIVENHILFMLKMPVLVASSHFLTTFCTKGCF